MDNRKIGKLIAELRTKSKLTQQELGDKIGVGFRAVSKWECGQTLPDIGNMKELSKIFGITLDELLAGKLKDNKKKLSKKTKIIISISSIIILLITSILIFANTKEKIYVYNISSVDKENYKLEGQVTFTEENILIVVSELKFRDESFNSTEIINYEYNVTANNRQLVGYGYSPFAVFSEEPTTIKEFSNNFKISSIAETKIERDEFLNSELYFNINFINDNNQIIEKSVKLKPTLVK